MERAPAGDVAPKVQDWGLTLVRTDAFTDELQCLVPHLYDGWLAEDLLDIASVGLPIVVSGLYVLSKSGVRVLSGHALTVLAVLGKMGMVHAAVAQDGVVTGGVITAWVTPGQDYDAFMVMARKLSPAIDRFMAHLRPLVDAARPPPVAPLEGGPAGAGGGPPGGGAGGGPLGDFDALHFDFVDQDGRAGVGPHGFPGWGGAQPGDQQGQAANFGEAAIVGGIGGQPALNAQAAGTSKISLDYK